MAVGRSILGCIAILGLTGGALESDGAIIISQYYEGNGTSNRFIELANTGASAVTLDSASSPYKLSLFVGGSGQDPTDWRTTGTPDRTVILTGSIPAGGTLLVSHPGATGPLYAFEGTLVKVASGPASINTWAGPDLSGNDSAVLWTGSTYSFAAVVDAFGVTATVGAETDFAATTDDGYVRNVGITTGVNTNFNPADWTRVSEGDVLAAADTTNNARLGYHQATVINTPEPATLVALGVAMACLLGRPRLRST